MSLWQRVLYAGALVAAVNAIGLLVLALAAPNVLSQLIREMHWLVFVELAAVLPFAPALSRYLPRRRRDA